MRQGKEISSVKNSIQTRLSGVMLLVLVFALGINVFIFKQIHTAVTRIDAVFSSNTAVNELSESLEQVESTVYEYLNTKSTQALENYYRYEQNYKNLIEELNDRNLDNEVKMLEKNIRRMSESYLEQTNETVQAKRGRNVEKYKTSYEDENELYEYINVYIYKLNNLRFKTNSANYQLLLLAMNVLYKLCIFVMLVVYALGLAVTTLLVRNMIRPLTALSNTAHEVAKGNLNVPQLPVVVEDEVGVVTRSFNQMLESIRQNIEQLKESMERQAQMKERELLMETHLKEAQLKYLQAQINPHFLYNTLDAIAWMCEDGKNEDAEEMVTALARLFRISISKGHELIPIEKEVEHAKSYLKIENYRYKNKFTYSFEVEESCLSYLCNKITLQPIIENAIYHGVKQMIDEGEIWIRIFEDGEDIIFQVEDNGIGMTEEQCREILRKEPGDRTGIGIKNVNDRIKIYFGSNYGLNITSELDEGTCVTIRMPKVREEEYEKK